MCTPDLPTSGPGALDPRNVGGKNPKEREAEAKAQAGYRSARALGVDVSSRLVFLGVKSEER